MNVETSFETGERFETPTLCKGKLPGNKPKDTSIEWYGCINDREIPSQMFQFPLDIPFEQAVTFFRATSLYHIIFFGMWHEWPYESAREAMSAWADESPNHPILVAGSIEEGLDAYGTVIRTYVIHQGAFIRPKLFVDPAAFKQPTITFGKRRGDVWIQTDPDDVCRCGRYDFNAMGDRTCC